MKSTRALAVLLTMCLILPLAGCSRMEDVPSAGASGTRTTTAAAADGENTDKGTSRAIDVNDEASYDVSEDNANTGVLSSGESVEYYVPAAVPNPGNRTVTLYIWSVDTWKTVQWKYRDNLTVQKLLEALAHMTNWELSTSAIKLNEQKVTIWWNEKSSLYTGFPARQNKEYIVFSREDLDASILDSVKKTITENLGPSYTVCYANTNGNDLVLKDVNVTIPKDEPFSSFWDYT